jgi:transcriptional regulator with XRE-family HTH domain
MESIGDRFRAIRAKTGLSQKAFAKGLSMSQSVIADIERGSQEPSKNILVSIAQKYHVSLDWLLLGAAHDKDKIEELESEVERLKKENSKLEEDIRKIQEERNSLDIENKEISKELIERYRQLVEIQHHRLSIT